MAVPAATAEASNINFVRGLDVYLRSGDFTPLFAVVHAAVALRRLSGFDMPMILATSHAYLPIIRKVFLRHAPDLQSGLRAFDVVESTLLPLIARLIRELHAADDGNPFSSMAKTEEAPEVPAFAMVSVDDELDGH